MYNNNNNNRSTIGTQRSLSGGSDLFAEPLTPPSRLKKNGGDDPSGYSPGLLDLHSFDTELISEV